MSYIICGAILVISALISIREAFKSYDSDYVISSLLKSTASLITIFIIFNFFDYFNNGFEEILANFNISSRLILACKLIMFVLVYSLIQLTIYLGLKLLNSLLGNDWRRICEKNKIIFTLSSGIIGLLKGTITLIVLFSIVVFINKSNILPKEINLFQDVKLYRTIDRTISNDKVHGIKKNLVREISKATVTYYNGVTLEDGVKSNKEINETAKNLVRGAKTDREKAKILYAFVGSNIKYDDSKADTLMGNSSREVNNSGAIEAFNTRTGVCFDYACLYVAMCKAVGLKVELVMGDAFDGKEYVSHAWNRVYLKDKGVWINVDPTFYNAGNYFGNKDFDKDHINSKIVGEW